MKITIIKDAAIAETEITVRCADMTEERLAGTPFARISKTVIANLKKMRSIKSAEHSRLMATMTNGEKLVVSRRYVSEIKEKLGV